MEGGVRKLGIYYIDGWPLCCTHNFKTKILQITICSQCARMKLSTKSSAREDTTRAPRGLKSHEFEILEIQQKNKIWKNENRTPSVVDNVYPN